MPFGQTPIFGAFADVRATYVATDTLEVETVRDTGGVENYVVPPGGATGQVLTKASATDGDMEWEFPGVVPTILQVAVSGAQYDSIADALAAITTNSSTNRFLISVGPGVFTEPTLQMKPYVSVVGSGITTKIVTSSPNQHVVLGSDNALLESCALFGATGSGFCAVYHESATGTDATGFLVRRVVFGDNNILVKAYGNVGWANVSVIDCTVGGASVFVYGFWATNNSNAVPGTILISRCEGSALVSPYPTKMFYAFGTNCQLFLDTVVASPQAIEAATTFAEFASGARLLINAAFISNWENGIVAANSGGAPHIIAHNVVILTCTNDVTIVHPSTTGAIEVDVDLTKVSSSASVSFFFKSTAGDGVAFNGPLYYAPSEFDDRTDITAAVTGTPTMGVIYGGELSTGPGAFNLYVGGGFGYYKDGTAPNDLLRKLEWGAQVPLMTANTDVYVYFNSAGTLVTNASYPDTTQNILLGRVVTGASAILYIEKTPMNAHHYNNFNAKMLKNAIGPVFASGCTVTDGGSRNLDVTLGTYYFANNEYVPAGGVTVPFDFYYHTAPGVFSFTAAQTVVNNTQYDDGTALVSLTASYYTKHLLMTMGGPDEIYILICGSAEYSTQGAAENGPLPQVPSFVSDSFVRLASVVVQQGNANIVSIVDERPRIGFASSSTVGGITDHASLTGLNSATAHPQYLLRDGTNAMTGNFNLSGNDITNADSTSTTTLSVTGTTQSTAYTNGSAVLSGGLGVAKNLYGNGLLVTADTTESTTTTDGALVVAGGGSFGKRINVGGIGTISNTTEATSTSTGALVVAGGGGFAKRVYVGNGLTFAGATSGTLGFTVPSTVTSYSVQWPSTVASVNGQVLSSTTGGVLTWETAAGVAAGTIVESTNSSLAGYTLLSQEPRLNWVSRTAAPATLHSADACTVGSIIYVIGGVVNKAFRSFDTTANGGLGSFTTLTTTGVTFRSRGALVHDGSNTLYYFGGDNGGGVTTVNTYNITSSTWGTVTSMPAGLNSGGGGVYSTALYASGGLHYVAGIGTTHHYNITSSTWSTGTTMANVISDFAWAKLTSPDRIICMGGIIGGTAANRVQIYTISTNTWSALQPMAYAAACGASGVVGGSVYAVCGQHLTTQETSNHPEVQAYTVTSSQNFVANRAPTAFNCRCAAPAQDGLSFYLFGGAQLGGSQGLSSTNVAGAKTDEVWQCTPVTMYKHVKT